MMVVVVDFRLKIFAQMVIPILYISTLKKGIFNNNAIIFTLESSYQLISNSETKYKKKNQQRVKNTKLADIHALIQVKK